MHQILNITEKRSYLHEILSSAMSSWLLETRLWRHPIQLYNTGFHPNSKGILSIHPRNQLISSFQFQYIKNKRMQQQFPQLPIWHVSIHTSLAVEGKLLYIFAVLFLTTSILRLLSLTISIHDFIFLKFFKKLITSCK